MPTVVHARITKSTFHKYLAKSSEQSITKMSNLPSRTLAKSEEKALADLKGKLSEKSLADEVTVEYLNVLNS